MSWGTDVHYHSFTVSKILHHIELVCAYTHTVNISSSQERGW